MVRYIFRIDDIHPAMDWTSFNNLMSIFIKKGVKPLIGIIPANEDRGIILEKPQEEFWTKIQELLQNHSVNVAMHGYNHVYLTKDSGILKNFGFNKLSEFAGLPYEEQEEKIKKGKEILKINGIQTDTFMAPSHTFDNNTIRILRKHGFSKITDGIGLYPYLINGMVLIPQQFARPRKVPFGVITFCIHLTEITDQYLFDLERFLEENRTRILSFHEIEYKPSLCRIVVNTISKACFFCLYKMKRRGK